MIIKLADAHERLGGDASLVEEARSLWKWHWEFGGRLHDDGLADRDGDRLAGEGLRGHEALPSAN
jgi:hypothetical protein